MKISPPVYQTSYLPVPAQAGTVIFKARKFQHQTRMSEQQQLKRQVGAAALAFLEDDMIPMADGLSRRNVATMLACIFATRVYTRSPD